MIISENLIKQLRQTFDLNIYEAKIWASLLSKGVSSAGELADLSGVPRSRSYDVLESLEKRGFVVMKLGKPIKYIAVKPEEVLKRLKQGLHEKALEHVAELDKVKDSEIFTELELLYKQGIDKVDPAEVSGLLKGRKNVHDHLKQLISEAQKSITIVTTDTGLKRKASTLKSALRKAKERGVKIRIAAPLISGVPEEIKDIAEIKNFAAQKARFAVIDGKHVVFMTTDDKEVHEIYDNAVWINSPFFASALEGIFEHTWKEL